MTDGSQTQDAPAARKGGTSNTFATLLGLGLIVGLGTAALARSGLIGGGDVEAANAIFAAEEADAEVTFASVSQKAADSGKAVFVLATADWCGPCQMLKRNTLSDERVQGLLGEQAVSYKLDVTNQNTMSPEDHKLAQELGVMGIPAYYVLKDGELVAKSSGYRDVDGFTNWLEAATE